MLLQVWILPLALLITATLLAIPVSRYLAWVLEGKYKPLPFFSMFETRIDSGPQNWKQYLRSLLIFTVILYIFSFLILLLQPWMPLNPSGKTLLGPSAIFNAVAAFITNTDLQHYSGDQQLSNFSQIFFGISNLFISSAMGLAALAAIIRSLRGDPSAGNFFIDIWRIVVYIFLPIALIFALIFIQQGSPMTLKSSYQVATLEQSAKPQTIVVGPVAAFEAIKMLGTNGGGFYAMNSAHPFENPTAISNFFNVLANMLLPFAIVLMYGRMLGQREHSYVIFAVMLSMMLVTILWTIHFDTLKPNPALIQHNAVTFEISNANQKRIFSLPKVPALPVDQHLGNLEGKEMRFGTAAGAVTAAITNDVTCGAPNAELDSLNPLAGLAPMVGIWLNCIFGGKGAGMINMLMFIIIGIFLAGMMVGRSPEYLGKKITSREVKLAIIGLLVHPLLILLPVGLFAATSWGMNAIGNPGAHGFSEMLYQFSSAAANNGSAFDGLNVTYGFYNNAQPASEAIYWDIATGLVMLLGRFIPIIAMVAMAAYLGEKKSSPFGIGTLRTDTLTFGLLLLGTIIIIGLLLFLPVGVLGPVAEHFGPIPFG